MKGKLTALLFAVCMCLSLSGCIGLFSGSYHSETEFSGGEALAFDPKVEVVRNYAELRRFVFGMVNNHIESAELMFSGYAGNAVSDIASVCNAVKTESAYGAYCVDYVAYNMTQIVSSYKVTITISYLYTADELQGILTISSHDGFSDLMAQELALGNTPVIIKVNNGTSDMETVLSLIDQTMRNHPLSVSYYPKASVKIYSGNSSQKIYEVNIAYDESMDNEGRLSEMNMILRRILQPVGREDQARTIVGAAMVMSNHCRISNIGGDTAYAALVDEFANSEGTASAFKAMCDELGIECLVVSGKIGKNEHYWNIVKVDSDYYHVDVSMLDELGEERSLFLRDADKQVDCWWNQAEYPDCDGELTYETAFMP